MLSQLVKWMKSHTDKDYLFTWAEDCRKQVMSIRNFYYGGFIWTDIYIGPDGEKITHVLVNNFIENAEFVGKDKLFWMTPTS